MTPDRTLAFLAFAIAVAGTPGPSNALLIATGAAVGLRRGLGAVVGVTAGMAALMFTTVLGLGGLIFEFPGVLTAIKLAGTVILLWLAWKIASARDSFPEEHQQAVRPVGFLGAAAFQWVNPKSWLACASAAAAFLDPSRGGATLQAAILALLFALAALPCCCIWLAFGAGVQRALRSGRAMRTFNMAMGALLVASAVGLLVTT